MTMAFVGHFIFSFYPELVRSDEDRTITPPPTSTRQSHRATQHILQEDLQRDLDAVIYAKGMRKKKKPVSLFFLINKPLIENCSICLESYTSEDTYCKLHTCGHNFHEKCIDTWFEIKTCCPVCGVKCGGV
jgi:hypothetical protein